MKQEYTHLSVSAVQFDRENPRIKKALEKYEDKINAERISFALRSADSGTATSSFNQLKDSIHANKGVIQPVTVIFRDGEYVCIDGNTRIAIYKDFLKEDSSGIWDEIPALVLHDAEQHHIEAIRMSAHLVGAREWPAYEKARYLHDLYHQKFMGHDEMIALCGGNKKDIQDHIQAFNDMNEYYLDVSDESESHIDRFSGFVQLQNPKVKKAIFDAGYELSDFGQWIKKGNIRRLEHVRQLPVILQDKEATKILVNDGYGAIEKAWRLVERKKEDAMRRDSGKINLDDAPMHVLAQALGRRIDDMPFSQLQFLQGDSDDAAGQVAMLESLADSLAQLLSNVRE